MDFLSCSVTNTCLMLAWVVSVPVAASAACLCLGAPPSQVAEPHKLLWSRSSMFAHVISTQSWFCMSGMACMMASAPSTPAFASHCMAGLLVCMCLSFSVMCSMYHSISAAQTVPDVLQSLQGRAGWACACLASSKVCVEWHLEWHLWVS